MEQTFVGRDSPHPRVDPVGHGSQSAGTRFGGTSAKIYKALTIAGSDSEPGPVFRRTSRPLWRWGSMAPR